MSKKEEIIKITPPGYINPSGGKTASEVFCIPGHVCSYCKGNGWFWTEDERGESVKRNCPVCHGSGELDAVVTVEWKPSKQ